MISEEVLPYQPFSLFALNISHLLINITSQISEAEEIAVIQMFIFSGVNWADPRQVEANCGTPGLGVELYAPPHAGR